MYLEFHANTVMVKWECGMLATTRTFKFLQK